jgi:spermidine/putrescine transport system permease protein
VTGIAVLILYNLINLAGSFMALVFGHILISMPFVIIIVSAQMYGFDRSLEEAAKNLGASELRTFYEVTLPLIAPGIIAGMLFAFTISFDNFTQTFFWSTPEMQTLPIVIYSKIRFGLDPTVNAIGTVIVTFSLTIAFLAERLSSRILGS